MCAPPICNCFLRAWVLVCSSYKVCSNEDSIIYLVSLSQTGSTLTRTNLSPFALCTLRLNRHSPASFIKIYYPITALHDSGLYIQKILTNREMVNFQKLDFLRFLTINSVTTGARKLNGTSQISLATHNPKREMREI